jgi:hypothetical protein
MIDATIADYPRETTVLASHKAHEIANQSGKIGGQLALGERLRESAVRNNNLPIVASECILAAKGPRMKEAKARGVNCQIIADILC